MPRQLGEPTRLADEFVLWLGIGIGAGRGDRRALWFPLGCGRGERFEVTACSEKVADVALGRQIGQVEDFQGRGVVGELLRHVLGVLAAGSSLSGSNHDMAAVKVFAE